MTNLGAVFTRRWVADLVLDLAGYTEEAELAGARAVEPSCGSGSFIISMVERLYSSCHRHGLDIADAGDAIIAFDIDRGAVDFCRRATVETLTRLGVGEQISRALAQHWIHEGDFLHAAERLGLAEWVIGNPPYVRVERADRELMTGYRAAWPAMSGRADIYVGFLQAGLELLEPEGRLAFICADRWMRNRYGAALRTLVENEYAMDACIVMHDVEAFEEKVSAYPAVTVIRAGAQRSSLVCQALPSFDVAAVDRLLSVWERGPAPVAIDPDYRASWAEGWFRDRGSWPAGRPEGLPLLFELEARLPTLAETGAPVSVGVATGADDVYLIYDPEKVDPSRLIRAVGAREAATGTVEWTGRYLVNTWEADGLVALDEHPKLASYLSEHAGRIKSRYIARLREDTWWRTIDRVYPGLADEPKLLIPDLKDRICPVLDPGNYYPLHSLYYIVAPDWDLEVLGGLLLSDVANFFVESYSVRMANGYLRVSAQYLRRVRVPYLNDISPAVQHRLRCAFRERDVDAATGAALAAYLIADWPTP